MAISHPVDSILAADIGSAWTRVVLIDRIEGHYRFVAASDVPTTSVATGATIAAGVRLALREIETGAGRTLLNAAGSLLAPEQPDGMGVDLFVATCSAAPPLQVFVAGLTERASLLGGERAASTTYSRVIGSFALGGKTASTTREPLSALVERLHASLPQAILLTGGTEGGATGPLVRVAEAVALAMAALPAERRPAVVFAGNGAAADSVRAVLAPVAGYLVGENVRPTEEREHTAGAGAVLHELYCERCLNGLPGVDVLRGWAGGPVLAPVEGLSRVARFVAARSGRRALGVDVGATSTALVIASDATSFHTEVRHGLGLGSGLEGVLAQTPPADLLGWVGPGEDGSGPAANQLADALGSYSLRPATRPQSSAALVQLQAAARAVLRLAMAEASRSWASAWIA
ncbi:MAG TPA: glutamate mutase L, partial [Ardenticatenaceae bacterium]|nr:glutamate mutase L [Ardenticatenaceae bacterium]